MTQAGLLFITTPEADNNAINRLLLHLRNWEFDDNPSTWDNFHIVATKDVTAFMESLNNDTARPTKPPYTNDTNTNEWRNATLAEVEAFMLILSSTYEQTSGININTPVYTVLDSKGLTEKTCIVGDPKYDDEAEEVKRLDEFEKARVPWQHVQSMWANLDIANMDFVDFCAEEKVPEEGNWWRWRLFADAEEDEDARGVKEQIEEAIGEFEAKREA